MKCSLIVVLMAGLVVASAEAKSLKVSRPNIVFLMSDDHRAMAMGCAGNEQIQTPNMDQLAAQGLLFSRCYASTAICMASRATVMTGMHEYKTGANFDVGNVSSKDWNTMVYPVLLNQAGYRIAFAGKWGFRQDIKDVESTFDQWGSFKGHGQGFYKTGKNETLKDYEADYPHVTRALGAFASDFVRESAEGDQPFCLSLSFKAPHKPHNEIDPVDQQRYQGITFPLPINFGQKYANRLPLQARLSRQYFERNEWNAAHYQEHLRAYYQLISGVDDAIGMVVESIDKAGVADNTVIIYTSDNGYSCGAHGLQGKVMPYEEPARIPLIIFDPRSPAKGKQASGLVCNTDFMPTILDLAGLPVPQKSDGTSLVPIMNDPELRLRKWLPLIQNWGWAGTDHAKALSIVTEEWKYIYWAYADKNVPPVEELFNLKKDRFELSNVIADPAHAPMLNELRKNYDQAQQHWAKNCVDNPILNHTAAILDRHTQWQEKQYQDFATVSGKKKPAAVLKKVYFELTGKQPEQ